MGRIVKIIFYAVVVLMIAYGVMYLIWGDKDPRKGVGIGLNLSYILLGIGAVGILVASLSHFIHHPKAGIRVLVAIAIVGVIAFIGYSISSGEIMESYFKYGIETTGQSKAVDAGLFVMYGMGVLAVLAIIASEISAAIKR